MFKLCNYLPDDPPPIITPVLRELNPWLLLPIRTVEFVLIIRPRERANCRDDVLGELFEPPDVLLADTPPPPPPPPLPLLKLKWNQFINFFKYKYDSKNIMTTYFFVGSVLLKSRRSGMTENATRNARPSSSNIPKWFAPITICFTGAFNCCNAGADRDPYLLILSETSRNLNKNKIFQ